MKKCALLVLAGLILPLFLQAQNEGGVLDLSLRKAVEYAVGHNKNLQVSQKNIGLYQEKVREAISEGLPQVSGNLSYSTSFTHKADFGGQTITSKDNMLLTGSISQLLFSGQWIVGVKSSKIATALAEQQVAITELDIQQNVMVTYFSILVSERSRDIVKANLENMNEILKHTKNMYEAGTVEITDVDQIQLTVTQLHNSLLSIERTTEVNYNLLRTQLGLPAGSPLTLTENLDMFLNEEIYLQLAGAGFDINKNAEYQLLLTQKEISEKTVDLKRWAFAPTLAASYTYQKYIKEGSPMAALMTPPHSVSINLSVPIFSGFQRRSQLNQAKIELEQADLNIQYTEDNLNVSDEQYRYELKNALENYNLQKQNVTVAQRIVTNYRHKYEEGVASSMDLTQSNSNYLQAESDFTSACFTLLQAKTQLERLYNTLSY